LSDAAAAGKAQLALDGSEIGGHKLRTGPAATLWKDKGEKNAQAANRASGSGPPSKAAALMPPPRQVKRPVLGKGVKRGVGFIGSKIPAGRAAHVLETTGDASANGAGESKTGQPVKKSNADFRSMFLQGGAKGNTKGDGGSTTEADANQNGH